MGPINVCFLYIIPPKVQKLHVVAYKCVGSIHHIATQVLTWLSIAYAIEQPHRGYIVVQNVKQQLPDKHSVFNPRSPAGERSLVHSSRGGDATDGRTPSQHFGE